MPQRDRILQFLLTDPNARDLDVSKVHNQACTGERRNALGGLASSSYMPTIRADSWYTTKAMLVAPPGFFAGRGVAIPLQATSLLEGRPTRYVS